MTRQPRYAVADTAQQVVGGFLLAGPFVVTEEVWTLAANMGPLQVLVTVGIVGAVGYGALYGADDDRDPDREPAMFGVPVRFLSLVGVAYGAVATLAIVFSAPETFLSDQIAAGGWTAALPTTAKAIAVGAIFSVVGAATADSIF